MKGEKEGWAEGFEKLEEWDYKLDRLEHRLKDAPDEIREKVQQKAEQLKAQRGKLAEQEHRIQDAAEHAIEEIEDALKEGWATMQLLFEEVVMMTTDGNEEK